MVNYLRYSVTSYLREFPLFRITILRDKGTTMKLIIAKAAHALECDDEYARFDARLKTFTKAAKPNADKEKK